MSTAHITIDQAGTNHLSIDGSPTSPVPGTGQAAQTNAMNHLREHAAQTQQTIALHVQDHDGTTFDLRVAPDGQVWSAPPTQPEPPQPSTAAPWEQDRAPISVPRVDQTAAADPLVTEVPGTQNTPDLETTRRRHAATPTAPTAPTVPSLDETANEPRIPQPIDGSGPELDTKATPEPDPVESDPRWSEISQRPAEEGFRGTLNGMGLKLAPTDDELEQRRERLREEIAREELERAAEEERARTEAAQQTRRAARAREQEQRHREQRNLIQTNFQGTKTILVANPKGGSRKTTTTYNIAATLGIIRGGSVIAWDANETMGTLGERARPDMHERTVVDLIQDAAAEFTSIEGSRLGRLDHFVRPQGDAHFDVLASDEDPTRQDIVDEAGFGTVHEILSRFYRMILVDTGNNIRVSHFLAAVEAADQLVIPVAAGRDSARAADKMMKSLAASGHEDLVSNAVVLIHDLEARTSADPEYKEFASDVAAGFQDRVGAIVPIPFDVALKDGGEIDFDALQPGTKRAYQEATAAIANSLRTTLTKENQS